MDKVLRRDTAITASALFGFSGLDRLYTGCYGTGFIKFLLFCVFMILGSGEVVKANGAILQAKILVGIMVATWYIYDLYKITTGSIRGSSERPFCGGYVWLDSQATPYYGSFVIVAAFIFFSFWLYSE